jgi:hypothetical protein
MQYRRVNSLNGLQFKPGRGSTRGVLFILLLLVLPLGVAQNAPTSHIPGLPQPIPQGVGDPALSGLDNASPYDVDDARRLRLLNAERQKSLVADTVKLLKLANELNAEIAKEEGSGPTPAEIRKIADIEKLARNVKEKMKITVVGTPVYRSPGLLPIP